MRDIGRPKDQETMAIEVIYYSEFLRERGMHVTRVSMGKHWVSQETGRGENCEPAPLL